MFAKSFPEAQLMAIAPGRVNLLGEHVDYNDGAVLPAAIDRAVHLAAAPHSDRLASIQAVDLKQTVILNLNTLDDKKDADGHPLPTWALYPAGVASVLQAEGLKVSGFKSMYSSDIPIGAGLSSSAAVEVAFAALWRELGGWTASNLKLAQLCQRAENQYVGVNCGLMDQFASANGVEGHALYFDTRSLEWHPVPLPPGSVLVIADSGVRRNLGNSAYNDRRAACEEAVSLLKSKLPEIKALRDVSPAQFAKYAYLLPEVVRMRARHIVEECARVDQAIVCLKEGDADGFGRLMLATHASLRDLYQVSTPELDVLVEIARDLPGCWGARLTGAGFGGCTVNLVERDNAGEFIRRLKDGYYKATTHRAEIYLCQASQGVRVQKIIKN